MASRTLKRYTQGIRPIILLSVVLLASLVLMSEAIQNSEQFSLLYSWLLVFNVFALLVLLALIAINLFRLVRQYRLQAPGSRLTARLVVIFVSLAMLPVMIVFYFSLNFLNRGIDSWFDVHTETALADALELTRATLNDRKRDASRRSERIVKVLSGISDRRLPLKINSIRHNNDAFELTVLGSNGRIIASTSQAIETIFPDLPSDIVLAQVRTGEPYIGIDSIEQKGLFIRVVMAMANPESIADIRILQALYEVEAQTSELVSDVQLAYDEYRKRSYLRKPLKIIFTFTLSLVLLLSLLTAVLAAFLLAQRLVAPIRVLAIGTRAVASGNYSKHLPLASNDELGFLVKSFNDMTQKIALTQDEVQRSQIHAERQRIYLETVLGRLSSGVLTFDTEHTLRMANSAANQILGVDLVERLGESLTMLGKDFPHLTQLVESILPHLHKVDEAWREEVTIFGPAGRQALMCRGSALPAIGEDVVDSGFVVVFDDMTSQIQSQRDAAWGEVARRLAHEIKNPLTPIRLSAERLRHKYLATMDAGDAEVLDRSTRTIVEQVESMQEMVTVFSEYAKPPKLMIQPIDINNLVNSVLELYSGYKIEVKAELAPGLPFINADAGRLRQVLHNLMKNAMQSMGGSDEGIVVVTTRLRNELDRGAVEICVVDDGAGISDEIIEQVFEPGVTTKGRGSGLGLAIVKKIIEEHGGVIYAKNRPEGGASFVIHLPVENKKVPKRG
ncbi:MAG TPA: HAMP domain-containing protein [Crenotrichaceae bacterium]|nr:HAMP domain-containing protein [Crenotrichaceae bacterium]